MKKKFIILIIGLFIIFNININIYANDYNSNNYNNIEEHNLINLSRYDSRDDNLVTFVKDQYNTNTCWAFATQGILETSILKGKINNKTKDDLHISAYNIAYNSTNYNSSYDPLQNSLNDDFYKTWNDGYFVENALHRMLQWHGPIDATEKMNNDTINHNLEYKGYDYILESYEKLDSQDINSIKQAILDNGSIAFTYYTNSDLFATDYYFGPTNGGLHASTIIGWDDNIDKNNFDGKASQNGAWIVKNSWSSGAHNNDGYFYLSYDSYFYDLYTSKVASKDLYDNNYYYDGNVDSLTTNTFGNDVKKYANIFKAKTATSSLNEVISAVNVSFSGKNTTVKLDLYKNVTATDSPISSKNDPISGEKVYSTTKIYKNPGSYTIPINKEIEVEANSYFSAVIEVSNPTNDTNILLARETSTNDLTYYYDNNEFKSTHMQNQTFTPSIKVFTNNYERENEIDINNLNYSIVSNVTNNMRYNENRDNLNYTITLNNKKLIKNIDYEVIEESEEIIITETPSYDDQIVAIHFKKIRGINDYRGEITITFNIKAGLYPPNFENIGLYDENNRILTIKTNRNNIYYKDIGLPDNYSFVYPNDLITNNITYLRYDRNDSICYRYDFFNVIVEYNDDIVLDNDIANSVITLENSNYYYNSKEIKPKILVKLNDIILKENIDYSINYSNNINAGKATIFIEGINKYRGSSTINFEIKKANNNYDFKIENEIIYFDALFGNEIIKYYSDKNCINEIDKPNKAGKYYVKGFVYGNNNYNSIETEILEYIIKDKVININDLDIIIDNRDYIYNNKEIEPIVNIYNNNIKLNINEDYIIKYYNNINVGQGEIIINGINKYNGEFIYKFNINKNLDNKVEISYIDGLISAKANYGVINIKYFSDTELKNEINNIEDYNNFYIYAFVEDNINYNGCYDILYINREIDDNNIDNNKDESNNSNTNDDNNNDYYNKIIIITIITSTIIIISSIVIIIFKKKRYKNFNK